MSYDLTLAARHVVDSLRARARIAARDGEEHLARYLELEANRLESPLLVVERTAAPTRPRSALVERTRPTTWED